MAFFQVSGMTFFFQISAIRAVKYERRYGQRLYHMIEIWSNGHGGPLVFVFFDYLTNFIVGWWIPIEFFLGWWKKWYPRWNPKLFSLVGTFKRLFEKLVANSFY